MKYLLLVVVVFAVLWLARSGGRVLSKRESVQRASRPPHEEVVACAQCGIHLPRSETLPGRGAVFCCEAHRSIFEQASPEGPIPK
ncbi:MAG: PP0621 family protein [Burkholderiaceae bacterium]|nr:PP0621 family protein [Burkholderiaceae bacterium]